MMRGRDGDRPMGEREMGLKPLNGFRLKAGLRRGGSPTQTSLSEYPASPRLRRTSRLQPDLPRRSPQGEGGRREAGDGRGKKPAPRLEKHLGWCFCRVGWSTPVNDHQPRSTPVVVVGLGASPSILSITGVDCR